MTETQSAHLPRTRKRKNGIRVAEASAVGSAMVSIGSAEDSCGSAAGEAAVAEEAEGSTSVYIYKV